MRGCHCSLMPVVSVGFSRSANYLGSIKNPIFRVCEAQMSTFDPLCCRKKEEEFPHECRNSPSTITGHGNKRKAHETWD